jgi:hypothetical protein
MNALNFSFEAEQFNRVFPFYVLLDNNLNVISVGKSLDRLDSHLLGKRFGDCFTLKQPQIARVSFTLLKELINEKIVLQNRNGSSYELRGQLESPGTGDTLLFIGTPAFRTGGICNNTHKGPA